MKERNVWARSINQDSVHTHTTHACNTYVHIGMFVDPNESRSRSDAHPINQRIHTCDWKFAVYETEYTVPESN